MKPHSAADVTAVISTHNRRDEVAKTLAILYRLHPAIRVLVVDNASSDDTGGLVASQFPAARVIRQSENNPLRGYNLGFEAAETAYVLVLDDDSSPKPGTLDAMVEELGRSPQLGAAAGNIVSPAGESEWGPDGDAEYTNTWFNLIGCGFLVRRDALRKAGGYQESFGLYYNDLDFGLRLLALGHAIAYSRSWQFEHRKSSIGRVVHRKTQMMFRNFSLIVRNYFRGVTAADLLLGHTVMMLRRAARERCLLSCTGSLLRGILLCIGGSPSPIPPSPGLNAFFDTYALSANLRRNLLGISPPRPAEDVGARSAPGPDGTIKLTLPRLKHPMTVPRVAAAIVTYNKREAVLALLARLREARVPAFVTANACSDGTADAIRRDFPEVSVLESRHNLGGTGGFNCATLAALSTGAPYIVLIDDDAMPAPDCLARLADHLDAHPDCVLAAPAVYISSRPDTLQETGGGVAFARDVPVEAWNRFQVNPALPEHLEIDYASACLLMVRSAAVTQLGVMDWNYFIFSDDVDWCLRLRRKFGRAVCVTSAKAWHDFPWAKPFAPARLYYFHRNGLYMLSRLRMRDPWLVSVRRSLLRLFRAWITAAATGDAEIATTLAAAYRDARDRRYGEWKQPVKFPGERRRLDRATCEQRRVRRVLMNLRIEDFDRDALAAVRRCAGESVCVDGLVDPPRVEVYRQKGLYAEVLARRHGRIGLLLQFFRLWFRRYDLVVTDAFMEPRGTNDMAGRASALFHAGELWEAPHRPLRTLLALATAHTTAAGLAWLSCWRFLRPPPDGVPPEEARELLTRIGVDPRVGQPWARAWPTPFNRPPETHSLYAGALDRRWQKAREALLRKLRLRPAPPPLPPPLHGGEEAGGYWAWCKARGPTAPGRYQSCQERGNHRGGAENAEAFVSANSAPRRCNPLFSIVVPVCDPKAEWLEECIASVRAQTRGNLELLLADDGSRQPHVRPILSKWAAADARIKVTYRGERGGISAATNSAAAAAHGAYLLFLDHDDMLDPFCIAALSDAAGEMPGVLYADEDRFDERRVGFWPGFKPDFSPDQLLATNYIHHPVAIRRDLFEKLGGLRSQCDGSQDHDLMLRAEESGARFVHVPDVLYHMRYHEGSLVSGSAAKPLAHVRDRELIGECLSRRGIAGEVEALPGKPGLHVIRRPLSRPASVSVLLVAKGSSQRPNAGEAGWDGCEVSVVQDDGVALAARLNAAARAASGEILLIVESSLRAEPAWKSAMLPHLLRPEIGLVTAKLVSCDKSLVACGLVLGIRGTAARWHMGRPSDDTGYNAWMALDHEVSAVPLECLAIRRQLFLDAGGFDTGYARAGFDVDLALRLTAERGLRHLAVASTAWMLPETFAMEEKRADWPANDVARLWSRWGEALRRGDPHYNPNLSLYDEDMSCLDREESELRARGVFAAYDATTAGALAGRFER